MTQRIAPRVFSLLLAALATASMLAAIDGLASASHADASLVARGVAASAAGV